jgi:iron(III) transport system permease protein
VRLRGRSLHADEWVMLGAAALVCGLIIAPIAVVFWQSIQIQPWGDPTVYSFKNYVTTAIEPRLFDAIVNTAIVSAGTTVLATIGGVSLAWLNARTNLPLRNIFAVTNAIPVFMSPFVGAIAWMALTAPRAGYLNKLAEYYLAAPPNLFNVYGIGGIIWVQGIFFMPFVYLMTIGTLRHMDPALEESSHACGSNMLATTWRITLKLSLPSILSGMILTFVSSAGEFGVPLALGSPYGVETLSTQIFEVLQRSQPDYNLASAMGSLLLVVTVLLITVHRKVISSKQYVTVTGKGFRPHLIDLKRWRYAALGANLVYMLVSVVMPMGMLFVISLQRVWLGQIKLSYFTWGNYLSIFMQDSDARRGIVNSLTLAITGASIAVVLSLLLSQAIYRSRLPWRPWIDLVTSLPTGIPGIVLSMGFLVLFIPTPLYGSLTLLLIAYIVRFIPIGQRGVAGVLLSTSPELEESSRACGHGWLSTMRRITLPLLKPGLAATWVLLFAIFLRELPISILLWSSGNEVMSVALYHLLEHGTAGQSAAYAIIQTVLILAVAVAFNKVVGGESIGS